MLRERGAAIQYWEAGVDDLSQSDARFADLLVVLGGPIGVGDAADYPFLADELAILEARLGAGRPTLGICLGAQLMTRALGARVYPGPEKEIGWAPVTLTEAGRTSDFAALSDDGGMVLHWHGDTFDLPAGASLLASTEICPNQAYSWGDAALALQFHAEVGAAGIERWLIGHACEIASAPGVSVERLRADTALHGVGLAHRAARGFDAWLTRLGL